MAERNFNKGRLVNQKPDTKEKSNIRENKDNRKATSINSKSNKVNSVDSKRKNKKLNNSNSDDKNVNAAPVKKKNLNKNNVSGKTKYVNKTCKAVKKNTSICEHFGICGGCQYIDKTNKEQLDIKYKYISKLLSEFGKVETILGMEEPYYYRNKNTAAFKHMKSGEILAGTYEEGSHRVVSSRGCKLQDKKADEIIETIRQLIKSFKITVHNEDTGYGLLKHVMVRTAHSTGQIMVILVTSAPTFPSKKNFARVLLEKHPEITTIVQNINEKHTSMVLGSRNDIMYGKGYIDDVLCGKTFRLSPNSFYQINSLQTEVLYGKAMEFAGLTGWETVIDAYCGIGTIGIVASDKAKEVIGVELNKDAVRDAILNSKNNKCKNISFYNNDAGKFMVGLANQNKHVDVVFMDPPRSGSDEAFMSSVIKLKPDRIVYISCGPESLARDLRFFKKHSDYRVERMVACDMFPFAEHVETVVLMSKGAVRPVDERFARTGAEA